MHTGDVLVRVSSNAWNQGAASQGVPDWQARGSTGTATKVTTDPRGMAGSRQGEVEPLPRVDVWKHVTAPVLQGPLPSAMETDHAPAAVDLPGQGGAPSRNIFSLPGRGHQRNTRNERICCARGTRNIGELGIVPPGTVMITSKLRW